MLIVLVRTATSITWEKNSQEPHQTNSKLLNILGMTLSLQNSLNQLSYSPSHFKRATRPSK